MLLMGKSTISMAIFNSYVSSPEGTWYVYRMLQGIYGLYRSGPLEGQVFGILLAWDVSCCFLRWLLAAPLVVSRGRTTASIVSWN